MNSFTCDHCKKEVATSGQIGTHQRNHCPFCLYSKHVDNTPGDRKAICHGMMKPLGLTFKQEGKGKVGELMLIHECKKCGKISINRIAGDDESNEIMETFEKIRELPDSTKKNISENGIKLVTEKDKQEIEVQLFGN